MSRPPGRKPMPTALKKLAGNPGRRPLNEREPEVPPGVPECPDFLNEVARAEWNRVVPILAAAGTLTELDRGAVAAYCFWWEAFDEAVQKLNKYGKMMKSKQDQIYQSPYMSQASQASKQMHIWAAELGLTSSSRTRLVAVKPAKDQGGVTKFFSPKIAEIG